ncbi:MAG: hypothetical protein AMXMBFR4_09490 [Candidatus Hydrogenedentota bacterium]
MLFITTCSVSVAPAYGAEAGLALVHDGRPLACVVLDDTPDARNREVANDFVAIVQRMTGATLPVERVDRMVPIHIGEPHEFAGLPFTVEPLRDEEFELRVTDDAVYVLGGTSLGTSHGVYTLLRDLGCRWVMPGAIGECLPDRRDVSLMPQERREAPDFRYREIWYAYGCSPEAAARREAWLRRNRMNRPLVQHGHNLTNTLAVFAPFDQRPDLYAWIHGKRKSTQICTSNPEAVALVVQAIKQYLKGSPQTEAYSLCPDDNTDFCECADCRALDPARMDSGGLPSVSDRYQTFLNGVLDGLKDEYPNVLVTTYSYNRNHTDPPVGVKVDPRTCIFATSSMYCSAHGIGDAGCASRQAFRSLLAQWTALTPHVYIYEYDPVPYSGGLPWPMWMSHAREMAAYRAIGVAGVTFEGQNSWAAYFPNYYIAAQCMWDTAQDGNELFDDLMRSFFLEAAPEMSEYHEAIGSAFDGVDRKVEWGLTDYPKYFRPEVVERCRKALEAAERKAASPLVKQRIEMVRLSFDEMDSYLRIRRADSSTTFEEYNREVNRLNSTIDRMAATNEDFLLATIAKEKTLAGVGNRFAREQGFINQWMLCGPFENPGMDGHDRVYPPEQQIDLDATYSGKGGAAVSWKRNRTPEWTGYVDLLNEFADTEWTCAYALCWVTVDDGPHDVTFRIGSNDSVKAFLNGAEVWNNKVERAISVDEDMVPVTLPAGTSTVLLKIGQTGLNWGFYFRITERASDSIPAGLRASAAPPK